MVPTPTFSIHLTSSLRDRAMGVFFQQYGGQGYDNFHYVQPFLEKISFSDPVLLNAIECVGTAYLSNAHSNMDLMTKASKIYTSILGTIHTQLINASTSQQVDGIIVTVMLLILFEVCF